ncbi:carbamoyl phosphate synthase small subunit [Lachnospiraceae bacterium ZAX-1]
MKAFLILEDGTIFSGTNIGSKREVISEIVFNTSMTGYLEVLTDPSYAGQAVVMTYPLIGNYGICFADQESKKPWIDGLIVRELSRVPSNFRSDQSIQQFLETNDIPGIAGIDTRALTKLLRGKGTMNGMITTNEAFIVEEIISKLKSHIQGNVVDKVTCKAKRIVEAEEATNRANQAALTKEGVQQATAHKKVALMDFGAKQNIIKSLTQRGVQVIIYPANTTASEILLDKPDGIMLTNGPGDPKQCETIIKELKKLYDSQVPIFAICLGHQLMALATGADTQKMKYGHRGGNHPVKNLETGRVYISAQNHGYVVNMDTVDPKVAKPVFVNVNDKTVEGLNYTGKNIYTVQFHPEACAGPQDSGFLFDRFLKMME